MSDPNERKQLSFYLNSQHEMDKLNDLAFRDGISKSAVIRQLILRQWRKEENL